MDEEVSNQAVLPKETKRPEPHQRQNPIVDESARIRISKILESFLESEAHVLEVKISVEKEREVLNQLVRKMGISYSFSGRGIYRRIFVHKNKKEDAAATVLESLPHVTCSEESNKVGMQTEMLNEKVPDPTQNQSSVVNESRRIWISQKLQRFLASNDEVYEFEANVFGEERTVVRRLARKMGFFCSITGRGINGKLFVHKNKMEDDTTTVLESLPCDTCSEPSNKVGMQTEMLNKKAPEPTQHQSSIVNGSTKILICQALENFLASNDKVYNFKANLSSEECAIIHQVALKMGFSCRFSGFGVERKISVYKREKEVDTTTLLECLPHFTVSEESNEKRQRKEEHFMPQKRQKKEKSESQHQNPVDESPMIRVSQILEKFLVSKDEVHEFEANLSPEECVAVHQLSQKMGVEVIKSGNQKISVHKIKKKVGTTTESTQKRQKKKKLQKGQKKEKLPKGEKKEKLQKQQKKEKLLTPQKRRKQEKPVSKHQNPTVDESTLIRVSEILEKISLSKDEVYEFDANLSPEECVAVHQLSQKMGFEVIKSVNQKISVHKIKKKLGTTTESTQKKQKKEKLQKGQKKEKLPKGVTKEKLQKRQKKEELLMPQKRRKQEKLVYKHQNPTVDEPTLIRVSQILEKFALSKDEVYELEANLSPEECVAVDQLSRKFGFKVIKYGNPKRTYVHKIKRKVGTTTELESLSHFTFSEESKQVLGGLLMHYPPGDEEFLGEMSGTNTDTTDKTKPRGDDFFGRPCMSKADIAMKLEKLAVRMKNPSDLKQIAGKRSELPIASFKDVITSTVDSHQVVLISGETGCGKTTQVPQFILDHMWGKGEVCKIVCTQPRRISATSVSERISCERGEAIGNSVGYKIRLESEGGRQSSIVLCTTGVLLQVLVSKGYSQLNTGSVKKGDISGITHVIMDEIHERDRYSDIMLAILRQMLPSYPHLRLILMSATVDAERFCEYFGNCPVIHVPGFTYPVKNFYLEDVLSIVRREDNRRDSNHKLSSKEKLVLDEAINLAWSKDEWHPLLELVFSKGGSKVFNYQHSLTGFTPLMVAAGKGRLGDVFKLLSLGADSRLQAKDGKTALEIAEMENQQVAVEMLWKHMANEFSDVEGKNLLDEYLATINPENVDVDLIEQLIKHICTDSKDGGILVFFPGWDEINKTRLKLLASPFFNDSGKFMIISLHSRVPSLEQKKVFIRPPHGCRKIVLSTNIAETAVTIDDIVYVIDSGRMKEKSYDPYNNVLTLQSSWVSKASAKQREGRAGRCQAGICYHLYSKVRAASLPDFRVPEIKRMPIEEICLQIKMLDPRTKIEEFLSKTLDPPVLETIQNGIAVLQELGALTLDEELTQLGEKLGSLPVHPSTSRMLLLAILTNCLNPALTLACAADASPFTLPISPAEKARAAAAVSELASLYGGCGDQFALVSAFECWQNAKSMGLEAKFCSRYFVNPVTIQRISSMRTRLANELFRNGLICDDVSRYCLNDHDPGILHAVLVAGMYPRVGLVCSVNDSRKRAPIVETESGDKVRLSGFSTNFEMLSKEKSDRPLVVYDEITRGDFGKSIRSCTVVGPLPLLLLSKGIAVAPAKRGKKGPKDDGDFMSSPDNKIRVIIDQWLCFEATAFDVSQIYYLRERLSAAMSYKVLHSTDVLPPVLAATVDALSCVLSCDWIPCTPQTSDGKDTPATTENETNLIKSAIGTEQAGENPKGSGTNLTNRDEHQSNPYLEVTISASVANENPSDQTSHDAPIDLACSIPTEHVRKIPEGSCSELINCNFVPSLGVSISVSEGLENPSDPNIAIRSASLIPAEYVGKNLEGSCTELINCDIVPSSGVSISASEGLETPSDPNIAISSASLIPTEYVGENLEGSCTELINCNIVPSSGVSISASEGLENPSDPNVAISSMCLIPTMQTALNAEEYHTALINQDTEMTDVPSSKVNISAPSCTDNPSDQTSPNALKM